MHDVEITTNSTIHTFGHVCVNNAFSLNEANTLYIPLTCINQAHQFPSLVQSCVVSLYNHFPFCLIHSFSESCALSWVVDIRKWFRRWGVDDLLGLSGDAMHYLMIEESLMESLRMK